MRLINKTFQALRTAFLLLMLFFAPLTPAAAQSAAFTVENVKVDVTAESAVAARHQAFEKAQVEALAALATRFLDEGAAAAFQPPDPITISTLILDYEITGEKLSTVRYIATYKFRFKEAETSALFAQGGAVVHTDVSIGPIMVLPYYQVDGRSRLWGVDNAWLSAWQRAGDLVAGGSPLMIPLGDLEDVRDMGDRTPGQVAGSGLGTILGRYGAGEAIVAEALPDDMLARVANESDAALGSLSVRLYRTDQGHSELVHIITRSATSADTLGTLMDGAVRDVRDYLARKDWKQGQVAAVNPQEPAGAVQDAAGGRNFTMRVPFASLAQWSEIQRALRQVPGVKSMNVQSLNPQQAVVNLVFSGDEQYLRAALAGANMSLNSPAQVGAAAIGGIYGNAPMPAPSAAIYDLQLNRYTPY